MECDVEHDATFSEVTETRLTPVPGDARCNMQRLWSFVGKESGNFEVQAIRAVCGEPLPSAMHLDVRQGEPDLNGAKFVLRGVTSNDRYVTSAEKAHLVESQRALGRESSVLGALIPIKKSDAWWALTQEERRAIFEERSHHIAIGHLALPMVARRLHHCRDLGTDEPFDFLTWFDFARADEAKFDDLLEALRATEEWQYVEREVDIRVVRTESGA